MTFVQGRGRETIKQGTQEFGGRDFRDLSPKAVRVIRALEDGAYLHWTVSQEESGWWLDGEDVTVAVASLLARDLVQRDGDGCARLSAPGAAWLRRRAAVDRIGQALVEGDLQAAEMAMPFREQHQPIRRVERGGRTQNVNEGESPLAWLRRRRDKDGNFMVSDRQFEAGERLRSDFERAGIPARVTSVWSGLGTIIDGGRGTFLESESQTRGRAQYEKAVAHLGQGLADVVVRVACYQEGLTNIEGKLGWPVRSAKVVLRLGLERLADFYGLPIKNNQNG